MSPTVLAPNNAGVNARYAHDPALRRRVTLKPDASCPSPDASDQLPAHPPKVGERTASKVTSADVLEALHHATGLPLVGDYYTHPYSPETVSVANEGLFDALNHVADAARLRWHKEDVTAAESSRSASTRSWLQFRSPPRGHPASTTTG
jgi:hypothetical protein